MPVDRLWSGARPPTDAPFRVNWSSPQARGLVGWWPFNASRGARQVAELARSGPRAAVQGTLATVFHPTVGYGFGPFTTANYLSAGNSVVVQNLPSGSALSVVAWCEPVAVTGTNQTIFSKTNASGDGWHFKLDSGDGSLYLTIIRATTNSEARSSTLFTSGLHCLAGVYAGSTPTLYDNGVQLATASSSAGSGAYTVDTSENIEIGRLGQGTGFWPFGGKIYEVRLYNVALTPAAINQIYNPATRWDLYQPNRRKLWAGIASSPPIDLSGGPTLAGVTVSGTLVENFALSSGPTLAGPSVAGTLVYTPLAISVSGGPTLPGLAEAGTLVENFVASGGPTLTRLSVSGTLVYTPVPVSLSGAIVLPGLNEAGTLAENFGLSGGPTLGRVAVSGTLTYTPQAISLSGGPTLRGPAVSGTLTEAFTLAGAVTLAGPVVSGTLVYTPLAIALSGGPTLNGPSVAGTIAETFTLSGGPTLARLSVAGTIDNAPPGQVSISGGPTLAGLTVSGTLVYTPLAIALSVGPTLAGPTIAGTLVYTPLGISLSGGPTLAGPTVAGALAEEFALSGALMLVGLSVDGSLSTTSAFDLSGGPTLAGLSVDGILTVAEAIVLSGDVVLAGVIIEGVLDRTVPPSGPPVVIVAHTRHGNLIAPDRDATIPVSRRSGALVAPDR